MEPNSVCTTGYDMHCVQRNSWFTWPYVNTCKIPITSIRLHMTTAICHLLLQAKIVEALLGFEVIQVSCGASHVLAVTNDYEVFSWGRGDNGWQTMSKVDDFVFNQFNDLFTQ